MIPADPGGRFSPILSWMSCSTRWSTNLPITPPATAPTAADASSGGANRPTASPTPPPQPNPLRPRLSPVCLTATLPSWSCVTRMTPSIEISFSPTSATSDSKSRVASSMSWYPATSTSVGVSVISTLHSGHRSAMNLMAVMLGRNTYAAALVVTKLERPVTSIGGPPSACGMTKMLSAGFWVPISGSFDFG